MDSTLTMADLLRRLYTAGGSAHLNDICGVRFARRRSNPRARGGTSAGHFANVEVALSALQASDNVQSFRRDPLSAGAAIEEAANREQFAATEGSR